MQSTQPSDDSPIAAAEAVALRHDMAEAEAYRLFTAARAALENEGPGKDPTQIAEFTRWIAARHATDEAWGAWAMAMDAQGVN